MNVKFRCRKVKMSKDGLAPIEVAITIKGERKLFSTGRKIDPRSFSIKMQKVKDDDALNEHLYAIRSRLYAIETSLINNGINVTAEAILNSYRNGDVDKSITLSRLFEIHNESILKKAERKLITHVTWQKYEKTKVDVMRYVKDELKKDNILVRDITPNTVENLFSYLLKFMSHNTAVQKMKQVKKVLRLAVEEGYLQASPFKMVLKKEKIEVNPLTIKEVNKIRNKDIELPRLAKIRDLFVFECYTGLAFTDLMSLDGTNFVTDEEGNRWIVKKRHKTNVVATIPILPIAKDILEKYNWQLPKISNVKYNAYLKELQDICGIKKSLHSHLARHTMATNLLNAGMDMVMVSKILGHSNSRITEAVYAKVLPTTIYKKIKEVEKKLSSEGAF